MHTVPVYRCSYRHGCHFTTHPSFCIGSQVIDYVDQWPHLGHIITNDCDDAEDIRSRKLNFISQANKVLFNFRNVDSATKTKLFKTYCTSFYGAEIWDLSHCAIESVCFAWRKGSFTQRTCHARVAHATRSYSASPV